MSLRTPAYRLHKPTGQAVVTVGGRDCYLGKYGSTASRAEYDRLIAEWLANGRQAAPANDATVTELIVGYLKHCDGYYRKAGEPTSEAGLVRLSLRVLKNLYGHIPAREFGPLALRAVQQAYVDAGLCRTEVNRRTRHVVRFFKWLVSRELVPPSSHHALKTVEGLRKGRGEVREAKPVKPVPDAYVDAVQPFVSRQVWAMIELQRLTGMRPGEAVIMRTEDLDTSGRVWVYTPERHQTEHHDVARQVYLGPQAQAIVKPWLRTELDAYLFSPAEAEEEWAAERRRNRQSKVQPSQVSRRKRARKRAPGEHYTSCSYRRAIARACIDAKVPEWHPNQLRHNAATRLRKEFGVDIARIILGNTSPIVTEIYAELDREKAIKVMGEVG